MAHQHHTFPHHICMLDGPEYPTPTTSGKTRYDELLKENERLKALLMENGISWAPKKAKDPVTHKMKTRKSPAVESIDPLPHLPMEIQLRILGFVMRTSFQIIDPFTKPRYEHLTKEERTQRKEYPIQILASCKAFHEEGRRLFFHNSFVFTQVAALENFSSVSREFRSTIKHVTLRVIGKYFDNEATKRDIFHASYHPAVPNVKIPIYPRPKGAEMDRGMHAYCWQHFSDFMMNLQIPSSSHRLSKLFPSLTRMRVDLVNFCEHLHYPGANFATVLRWHTGAFLDELIITGIPDEDPDEGPERMFTNIVKDEGVFASGPPIFVSQVKALKSIPPLGLAVRVVRADEETKVMRSMLAKDKKSLKRLRASFDPEDGKPPKSMYPHGRTIWRFTQDSLKFSKRKWIEFDRASGYPAEDVDMWSDMDDSVMYDMDGNPIDEDVHSIDSDDSSLSDEDMDDDDDLPALLVL